MTKSGILVSWVSGGPNMEHLFGFQVVKVGVFYTRGDGTCLVSSMGGSCSGCRASAVAWSSGLLTVFESPGGSS